MSLPPGPLKWNPHLPSSETQPLAHLRSLFPQASLGWPVPYPSPQGSRPHPSSLRVLSVFNLFSSQPSALLPPQRPRPNPPPVPPSGPRSSRKRGRFQIQPPPPPPGPPSQASLSRQLVSRARSRCSLSPPRTAPRPPPSPPTRAPEAQPPTWRRRSQALFPTTLPTSRPSALVKEGTCVGSDLSIEKGADLSLPFVIVGGGQRPQPEPPVTGKFLPSGEAVRRPRVPSPAHPLAIVQGRARDPSRRDKRLAVGTGGAAQGRVPSPTTSRRGPGSGKLCTFLAPEVYPSFPERNPDRGRYHPFHVPRLTYPPLPGRGAGGVGAESYHTPTGLPPVVWVW